MRATSINSTRGSACGFNDLLRREIGRQQDIVLKSFCGRKHSQN
jgi:hypothetical protein